MSELLLQKEKNIFDKTKLLRGDFLRVMGQSWREPKNTLVVKVDDELLTVLFLAQSNAAVSYLKIKADEVARGFYQLGVRS